MRHNIPYIEYLEQKVAILLVAMILVCCADYDSPQIVNSVMPLTVRGEINQMAVSRVNDNGFVDGDRMGVYVVDYEGGKPGMLHSSGNRATNVCHTFDENQGSWIPSHEIYWRDDHTHADIYAYYPFEDANPDVCQYAFELLHNQNTSAANGRLSGYEASDFLWGKAENVAPTSSAVRLSLSHILSSVRVSLSEGVGFDVGEWEQTDKQILVTNTRRKCNINMSVGAVETLGSVDETATIPSRVHDEWRAIVLPQTVNAGTTMFAITVDGVPYKFAKEIDFVFQQGKLHNFTIIVDKTAPTGKYKLTLKDESITGWENDLVSHDAKAREYLVVNSKAGRLREAMLSTGKDFKTVRNLKLTGWINSTDFYFMRDSMDLLSALNLKQVRIKGSPNPNEPDDSFNDDQIPADAFFFTLMDEGKQSLCSVILPDTLVSIGTRAFRKCRNLTGSLIIPEGVVDIQQGAFSECLNLNGSLRLPSTLRKLGNNGNTSRQDIKDEANDYYGGVFQHCSGLVGDLIIPDGVELIRGYCFEGCSGFDGRLHLPEKLKHLGVGAFSDCNRLSGSLVIPVGVSNIPLRAFWNCSFDGTLLLHDGITSIESSAFGRNRFRGELSLPRYLNTLGNAAFLDNNFSGTLVLPQMLRAIGDDAFRGNGRITGVVVIPEGMLSIGEKAFFECTSLEGLVFPETMETIRSEAFANCYGLRSIVCNGAIPPSVAKDAFDGISKENFTVEVPEPSVMQYATSAGWKDFKHISAHHELVCSPSVACALGTEHIQQLSVSAEGEWELAEKPSWCDVWPSSGNGKTHVTLTIKAMTGDNGMRTGEVIFRLKEKGYTHACSVTQYGYRYAEDEILTMQKADTGKNGGINIVILGDGYDAKAIADGSYLRDMQSQIEHFFAIEPYSTYRNYFNVYTAFPLSAENGVGTVNTVVYNRFNTIFTGSGGMKADYDEIFSYVRRIPTVTTATLSQTLVIIVPNTHEYGGRTQMWEDGRAISFCPFSDDDYPYDSRGVIQHEAGGHGFGKLADESVLHNAFIDACGCGCCGHEETIRHGQSLGWYDNVSLTNKTYEVPWSHLLKDSRYNGRVDIYEGAFMHSRGVFRSEQNSCMNNYLPYYNAISRESIVRRIMRYAGIPFSFEDFVLRDK